MAACTSLRLARARTMFFDLTRLGLAEEKALDRVALGYHLTEEEKARVNPAPKEEGEPE